METWILYALASAFIGGFYAFSFKVIAQRNYDTYLSTIYSYGIATILSWLLLIYSGNIPEIGTVFFLVGFMGFINIFFYSTSILTRVESMRNIDSVIFFPLYKTFWPIMVTTVSVFIFQEHLSWREIMGIIFGILVPLMLLTKSENHIQKNLWKGVIFVVITSILTSISSIIPKFIHVWNYDIELFIFTSFLFGMMFSVVGYLFHSKKSDKKYRTHQIAPFSMVVGMIHFLAFYTFMRAISGNLAIAFTINSFSILVPIILSIIFYGEHFNLKKGIVIGLSIISILLFL